MISVSSESDDVTGAVNVRDRVWSFDGSTPPDDRENWTVRSRLWLAADVVLTQVRRMAEGFTAT